MNLFGKRIGKTDNSQYKEKLLGSQLVESRYSSLSDLLLGELNLNSEDAKKVTMTFPGDRTVQIWASSGEIVAATDSARPINYQEFLYWHKAPAKTKSSLITDVSVLSPETYATSVATAPELQKILQTALLNSTVQTLLTVRADFDTYESAETSIVNLPETVEALSANAIQLQSVEETLNRTAAREDSALSKLGASDVSRSDVTLHLLDDSASVSGPENLFAVSAADAESNVAEALSFANGFLAADILEAILELNDSEIIKVELPASEELPDLVDVTFKPYERIFTITSVGADLTNDVERVFNGSPWHDTAVALVHDQKELEDRVVSIDDQLIYELSGESFDSFDDLPTDVQSSLAILLRERSGLNSARVGLLRKLQDNILVEDETLTSVIQVKLDGIDAAVIRVELPNLEPQDHDFVIDEQELTFEAPDAVVGVDENGDPVIREANGDEPEEDEVDTVAFFEKMTEVSNTVESSDEDDWDHAFDFEEKAPTSHGIPIITPAEDGVSPIFLATAARLGLDPEKILR